MPAMKRFLVFLSLLLCVSPAFGEVSSGRVIKVLDGDTIEVLRDREPFRIRLYGIDCPERGQDFGNRARQFTSDLVFGKKVEVRPVEQDQFGRTVAWVNVGEKSLNHELVKAGLAWHYKRYAPKEKELARLEDSARKGKVGLWSHPNPVPPWAFRRQRKP